MCSLDSSINSCNALALVHIDFHRKLQWCTFVVDKVDKDRLSSVGRLAWDIEGWVVPPFRVHFANKQLIPKAEWLRSIGMQQRPMLRYSSNHMRCECFLSRSVIGEWKAQEKQWKVKFHFTAITLSLNMNSTSSHQLTLGHCWKYSSPTTFSFSKNSTVCHNPIAPLASRQDVSMRIAVAVIAPADRLQHP